MDSTHTTTTCPVRAGDDQWRNSEVSLGARSLLVRAIDGSAPVEWLPYDDVANVTEVDDPAVGARFIEITARGGRRLSMQLDPQMVGSLVGVLSGDREEDAAPRPAEFELGDAAAPASMFSTKPPDVSSEPSTTSAPAQPSATTGSGPVEPGTTGSRRTWILLGALLAVVVLAVGLFLLLGGDDADTGGSPAPPTTDAPDIEATPEPDEEARTTTTVPTTLPEAGPASALTVEVDDVAVETGSDSPAVYLAFATTNETSRDVRAYDVEVTLSTTGAEDQSASWSVQFRCEAPLAGDATRTGSFADRAPGTDLDSLVDCRVGAWPLDADDVAQSAFVDSLAAGAAWSADVRVLRVELDDGTVLG